MTRIRLYLKTYHECTVGFDRYFERNLCHFLHVIIYFVVIPFFVMLVMLFCPEHSHTIKKVDNFIEKGNSALIDFDNYLDKFVDEHPFFNNEYCIWTTINGFYEFEKGHLKHTDRCVVPLFDLESISMEIAEQHLKKLDDSGFPQRISYDDVPFHAYYYYIADDGFTSHDLLEMVKRNIPFVYYISYKRFWQRMEYWKNTRTDEESMVSRAIKKILGELI